MSFGVTRGHSSSHDVPLICLFVNDRKHPTLLNFKFQNLKNFKPLFSNETVSGDRKLTSKKERAKSKGDRVKGSDSDKNVDSNKQSKFDSIIF